MIKKIDADHAGCGVLVDRSLGRHPARRAEAWLRALRQRQGAHERLRLCRIRSRCIASRSTRRGSTWSANIRPCPMPSSSGCRISASPCRRPRWTRASPRQFPLILSSGRLVEYEGGGEETRSNKWLAELQQDMFIEINTSDAAERGIKDGGWVWVTGAENCVQGQDEGAGHRARRQGRRLDAVPLRRLVRGRGSAQQISDRAPIRSCSAKARTRSPPTATTRRRACRNPKSLSVRSERHKEAGPWRE